MDEYDLIQTPENVELERPLAGIGTRFIALLLDSLLIGLILLLLALAMLAMQVGAFVTSLHGQAGVAFEVALAILIVLAFVIVWGYFVLFEAFRNGQTPGKRYMQVRIVRTDGAPIGFMEAAIRNLIRVVDFLPSVYALGGVVMFFSRKAQRLGDLAAGTVAVLELKPNYAATDKGAEQRKVWEQAPAPLPSDPKGLTTQEYQILSNYWMRREQLTLDARMRLLPQLLRPVLERMGEPPFPSSHLESMELWVVRKLGEANAAPAPPAPPAPSAPSAPPAWGGRP